MSIDDSIRQAMQAGKFDDLSGKGKPLRLDDDAHVDPEWRLAYHVLKENGFSLPWIELRREIEVEIDTARAGLRLAWERKRVNPAADIEWQRARQEFSRQVERINRRIRDHNLQVPTLQVQMKTVNLENEIADLQAPNR